MPEINELARTDVSGTVTRARLSGATTVVGVIGDPVAHSLSPLLHNAAFEEMGLFGAPLRQAMNFDFYTDDDKLTSHNTIVSQGGLARNHTDGDFNSRQRLRLVVTAQQGAIRFGGY